jgi:hypothetical protein
MPHSDREAFERVAGDLLAELGYETRAAPNVSGAGLASSAPPSRG